MYSFIIDMWHNWVILYEFGFSRKNVAHLYFMAIDTEIVIAFKIWS